MIHTCPGTMGTKMIFYEHDGDVTSESLGHERRGDGGGNEGRSIVPTDKSPESLANRPLLHVSLTLSFVDPLRLSRWRRL